VAVATIGAPSDPEHVVRHLEEHRHEIESRGEAEVEIAGRSFRIRRQLLDDLAAHTLEGHIENLGRPLLVLHSPADEVVSIENGQRIFERARYPKSFVALDGADHLLLGARDSRYVGALLASWVERYLLPAEVPIVESLPAGEVWTELGAEGFTTLVRAGHHELLADEPEAVGGDDRGPSPYDYLLAGLGACTAMTLRMYATRKAWPLDGVHVRLRHARVHATDCADCATTSGKISRIERNIELTGPLDQDQQQRLLEIADRCPVHRTLSEEIEIVTTADRGKA
jgi:putative redox protein